MIRGLYTAASAMEVFEKQSSIRANNLANVNTNGFKKSEALTSSFKDMLLHRIESGEAPKEIGEISTGSRVERSFKNMSQGDLEQTGNKLDFAIQGEGFFVIDTANGLRYSRDGNFTLNSDSELVTQQGNPVLDTDGERIQLIPGQGFNMSLSGRVSFSNGLEGSEIQLVNFADEQSLTQEGDNLYRANQAADVEESEATIVQGYLESSNVKIVNEMVKMIKTTRNFESNQKIITSLDESLNKVINEVGKA